MYFRATLILYLILSLRCEAQMQERSVRLDYLTEITLGIGPNTLSLINLFTDTAGNNSGLNTGPVFTLFSEFPVGNHCTIGGGYSYGRSQLSGGGSFAYLITQTIGARILLHTRLHEPGFDFFFGFRPGYTFYKLSQPIGTTTLITSGNLAHLYLPGFIVGSKFRLPSGLGFHVEGALFSNYLFNTGLSYQF